MKAILLDIEGTTTPIDFVHETLFPFARERVAKFVETHFSSLYDEINQLVDESAHDSSYTIPVDPTEPGSVSAYLKHLIDVDRKSTPLKSIQGKIWKSGYGSGELVSTVFEDVPRAFERWRSEGKMVAIFSSGSVLAQKLLFAFTTHGDLTRYISAYFDTSVGNKRSADSYRRIATEMGKEPSDILFVSDLVPELEAASAAGMQVVLSVRKGNSVVDGKIPGRSVESFDEIDQAK